MRSNHPTLFQILAGYICAVLSASFTASLVLSLNGGDPMLSFLPSFMMCVVFAGTTGLPGFTATVILARHFGWTGWLPFTVAGAANALVAWGMVFNVLGFHGTAELDTLSAILRGGAVGGVCYWWAVYGKRTVNTTAEA